MRSIKESLLNSLNESRSSKGNIRKATEVAHKLLVNVDDEWTETSIYDLWMKSEEIANDEESFTEWYEASDFNKILSYDEALILMTALNESYDYLELEIKGKKLTHKIKRRLNKAEYDFISEILPYGIAER